MEQSPKRITIGALLPPPLLPRPLPVFQGLPLQLAHEGLEHLQAVKFVQAFEGSSSRQTVLHASPRRLRRDPGRGLKQVAEGGAELAQACLLGFCRPGQLALEPGNVQLFAIAVGIHSLHT